MSKSDEKTAAYVKRIADREDLLNPYPEFTISYDDADPEEHERLLEEGVIGLADKSMPLKVDSRMRGSHEELLGEWNHV